MRLIGHLPSERIAKIFGDFLYVQGIVNEIEADKEGWAVWIHSEDELERARELMQHYLAGPDNPRFREHARQAPALREREDREKEAAAKRSFGRREVFRSMLPYGVGPLTFGLVFACVMIELYLLVTGNEGFRSALHITRYEVDGEFIRWHAGLAEVFRGELWRLFTPVLLHGGVLHLVLNMMWLVDLGSMIEGRQGTWRLTGLVMVIAGASNLGQYWTSGPNFVGMSGVVYGLLGYIWMQGKFNPWSGLFLHPQTVTLMMIWFFVCFTGWVGNIANTAHAVGLGMGIGWGYASAWWANRSR